MLKKCSKCRKDRDTAIFCVNSKSKDGLRSICKYCDKVYRKDNKEKRKLWRKENKEKISNSERLYKINNKDRIKEYRENNKEKLYEYSKQWKKQKLRTDHLYKLKVSTRSLIYNSFRRGKNNLKKNKKTEDILGCTMSDFIAYIESKFAEGMTLDNHGKYGWHLDHIIPISLAKTEEDILKLNHYTNFQPLWWEENLTKGNKII